MVFASNTEVRGYYLESEVYFLIANNLSHAVGVSLDANYVYWTDVTMNEEGIFRSTENGSDREQVVVAGT